MALYKVILYPNKEIAFDINGVVEYEGRIRSQYIPTAGQPLYIIVLATIECLYDANIFWALTNMKKEDIFFMKMKFGI
jgi:hypothetical protein